MRKVFVYGSLMKGFHNHQLLAKEEFLGVSRTVNKSFMLIDMGAFPGAIKIQGPGQYVYGEVYNVSEQTLKDLDILECHPRLYYRRLIEIDDFGDCWMYLIPTLHGVDESNEIKSGSWRQHRGDLLRANGAWRLDP